MKIKPVPMLNRFLVISSLGCSDPQGLDARLDRVNHGQISNKQAIDSLSDRVKASSLHVNDIVLDYNNVKLDFIEAKKAFNKSRSNYESASENYLIAIESYRAASMMWSIYLSILTFAASYDYINFVCDTQISKESWRATVESGGHDLTGIDVDHIWPKSLGGADNSLNLQPMESGLNRSLGNGLGWKAVNQPLDLIQGMSVSFIASIFC